MRLTPTLFKQHIGWHFERFWNVQRKRKILSTRAEKILREKGILVEDANEFLKEKIVREKVEVIGYRDKTQPLDQTHPNWHNRTLLTYKDNNVLLEGLKQAKLLTNTVEIKEGLPDNIDLPEIKREFNRRVKKLILGSHILDAEQEKLPIVKDPERPAWNFPRTYGVSENRVFNLFVSKFLNLIEANTNPEVVRRKYIANDVYFSYFFEKYGNPIQFSLRGDTILLSDKPLSPVTNESGKEFELPDIFPVKPTITLNEENIYVMKNIYAVKQNLIKKHPHTLFINFDKESVKNLYEEEVTDEQIYGRSLLKTFTAAASYARACYGDDVKNLPTPVTIQSIQTDCKTFYFGVLQLNTLDLDSLETKNIWYQIPGMPLFDTCSYKLGKPVLEGYNKEVVKHILGFYNTS